MFTCILLSAGSSQRFGSPKALARLHKETIIERLQKLLLNSQVDEIIIVLGAHADQIKPHLLKHKTIKLVYNKDYIFGQTSSFKLGLQSASKDMDGFLLLPIDYPFVKKETVNALIDDYRDHGSLIIVPSFEGKKGHPPLFACRLKDEFLGLDNASGLNSVGHHYQAETKILPVSDSGVIQTFNSKEEFELLMNLADK